MKTNIAKFASRLTLHASLIFFASLLTLHASLTAQQYGWKDISANIPGDSLYHDLSDVFFINDNEGWITSGSHAEIYHTTDGGETFEIQPTQYSCSAIHMINEDEGYAGGENGRVYRTTDGGENWIAIGSIGVTLYDISFPPGTSSSNPVGYACGDNGHIWEISSTLTNLNTGLTGNFYGISAPSLNNVWACGGNRVYYYDGTDFTSQIAPGGTFNDIHFINNQEGWVVGDVGIIGFTTDGGANWNDQTNPDTQNRSLYGVFFLDSSIGWIVGFNGIILHTIDGGITWNMEASGLTTVFLRGVQFTSPTNGYLVGNKKTLLKYTEVSGIGENVEALRLDIYPNPAEDKFKVQSQKFKVENATIEIYDLNGRKLLEKHFPAGNETMEVDVSGLESGFYFVQLQFENQTITKKLIIQK